MTHASLPHASPSDFSNPCVLERDQLAAEIERRVGVTSTEAGAIARDILASLFDALERPPVTTHRDPPIPRVVDETNARAVCNRFLGSVPGYPAHRFAGRGIVTCAGGPRFLPCAWVLIHMLRRAGCTLPVQMWHFGVEEVDARTRALFAPLGVECVDALEVRRHHPARILNGWELKPYAIIHSSFEEVLFLDADNVPLLDPTCLFESAEYQSTGALFWPDVEPLGPAHPIFDILDLSFRAEPSFESGQIAICKRRHWRPLALAMHMNEHSDFYYRHVHGDKDTFHLAFRLLDVPYTMIPTPVGRLRGGAFCQHDLAGRLLFQHRLEKWEHRDVQIEGFEREADCFELLSRFDDAWRCRHESSPV